MSRNDITETLAQAMTGASDETGTGAGDALFSAIYGELHELAERKLRNESPDHVLQPTALVHEAYLRLVDQTQVDWRGRTHFQAVAAQAMRRILVDCAREKNRQKRGGGWRRVGLHDAFALTKRQDLEITAFHDALEAMRRVDPRQTEVVELRVLGGLTAEETAQMLDVSVRTVDRDWKMAQAWLRRELSREPPP